MSSLHQGLPAIKQLFSTSQRGARGEDRRSTVHLLNSGHGVDASVRLALNRCCADAKRHVSLLFMICGRALGKSANDSVAATTP